MGRLAILADGRVRALGSVQALRERVSLPLRLRVQVVQVAEGAMPALQAAVAPHVLGVPRVDGSELHAELPRDAKMSVLAALTALGAQVQDIQVIEPSLEDLFFGVAE